MLLFLQRLGYRGAYNLVQVYWFIFRPQVNGVKIVVRDGDDVLFVRHTYGKRNTWDLPGGGRRLNEDPLAAAQREAREELGVELANWQPLGEIFVRRYATAALTCFTADHTGEPLEIRRREIAELRWAPLTDPPRPAGKDVDPVLGLL